MIKVATFIGIRPDIIRLSKVIKNLDSMLEHHHRLIDTGQHYDKNLHGIFYEELGVREPDVNLKVGSGTCGEKVGRVIEKAEKTLIEMKPDVCIVLGDNDSALGASIATVKLNIPLIHIEAGMRSFDWRMPEEKNRRMIDHIATWNLCYMRQHKENLLREGLHAKNIFVVGNPITDVLNSTPSKRPNLPKNIKRGEYILTTFHREENTNNLKSLEGIVNGLRQVSEKYDKPIIFPAFPKTITRLSEFGIKLPNCFHVMEPQGFMEFIWLEQNAFLIATDSGTVMEEANILEKHCITLRDSTERPELIETGRQVLSGTESKAILKSAELALKFPIMSIYYSETTNNIMTVLHSIFNEVGRNA